MALKHSYKYWVKSSQSLIHSRTFDSMNFLVFKGTLRMFLSALENARKKHYRSYKVFFSEILDVCDIHV
jgi:hypothetical protein